MAYKSRSLSISRLICLIALAAMPLSAQWANAVGFNFRSNFSYVSDPTNTLIDAGGVYDGTTTRTIGAVTLIAGWETSVALGGQTCSAVLATDDLSTGTGDARLAGRIYVAPGGCRAFRVNTPTSGGTAFKITTALGDALSAQSGQYLTVWDDTTLVATVVTNGSTGSAQWYDADGTLETSAANWTANHASHTVTVTIASGILRFKLNNTSGSGYSVLAHLNVEQTAGGGSATPVKRKRVM